MRRPLLAIVAVPIWVTLLATTRPAAAAPVTLQQLINGETLQLGGFTFEDFSFSSMGTNGAVAADPSAVTVSVGGDPSQGSLYLVVSGNSQFFAPAGSSQDSVLDYNVVAQGFEIDGANLEINALPTSAPRIKVVTVSEGISPIGTLKASASLGQGFDFSLQTFPNDVTLTSTSISESIKVDNLDSFGGIYLDDADNVFNAAAVPEPSGLMLLGIGAISVLGFAGRARAPARS